MVKYRRLSNWLSATHLPKKLSSVQNARSLDFTGGEEENVTNTLKQKPIKHAFMLGMPPF